jgi:hypothetical protein
VPLQAVADQQINQLAWNVTSTAELGGSITVHAPSVPFNGCGMRLPSAASAVLARVLRGDHGLPGAKWVGVVLVDPLVFRTEL